MARVNKAAAAARRAWMWVAVVVAVVAVVIGGAWAYVRRSGAGTPDGAADDAGAPPADGAAAPAPNVLSDLLTEVLTLGRADTSLDRGPR